MTAHVDLLTGHALDALDSDETLEFEALYRSTPTFAEAARELREAFVTFGISAPSVDAPPTALRARVLAIASPPSALAKWSDRVARFFDVSADKARALLDAAVDADTWDFDALPGVGLMHLGPGPRIALADAGLVRFPAGLHWPMHRHIGEERTLVLSGGFRDDAGHSYGPGDELVRDAGSVHALDVDANEPCICAVTLFDGLEMPPGNPVGH